MEFFEVILWQLKCQGNKMVQGVQNVVMEGLKISEHENLEAFSHNRALYLGEVFDFVSVVIQWFW